MNKILFFCMILSFVTFVEAAPVKVITGEFAPYTGENLPGKGLSTKLVQAIYKELKLDVEIEFTPWNRAVNGLKAATIAGSFPWAISPERQEYLLFSNPIHTYKIYFYVAKGANIKSKNFLHKKTLCQPSGWEVSMYQQMMLENSMNITRPINMESCFRMLAKRRVDVIAINEHVGMTILKEFFPKDPPIEAVLMDNFKKDFNYYYVIPKKYPNAQKMMNDFNNALEKVKSNPGTYNLSMSL